MFRKSITEYQSRGDSQCPFCENAIPEAQEESYYEATHAELRKIKLQLEDLAEADADLTTERKELEDKAAALREQKSDIESLLSIELRPKAALLKTKLEDYRKAVELKNEENVINELQSSMQDELFVEPDEDDTPEFSIKKHYSGEIMRWFKECLVRILDASRYEGFSTALLDPGAFDIVVNGKQKKSFGKGYRALLNTLLALSLAELLKGHGKNQLGLLVIDSPILTLKEKVDDEAPDSMKAGLFQYLLDNQDYGQIIIIENDVPSLDYSKANVIEFTQDEMRGRYGLLKGVLK